MAAAASIAQASNGEAANALFPVLTWLAIEAFFLA